MTDRCETTMFCAVGEAGWQEWRCQHERGDHPTCALVKEGPQQPVLAPRRGLILLSHSSRAAEEGPLRELTLRFISTEA